MLEINILGYCNLFMTAAAFLVKKKKIDSEKKQRCRNPLISFFFSSFDKGIFFLRKNIFVLHKSFLVKINYVAVWQKKITLDIHLVLGCEIRDFFWVKQIFSKFPTR